MITLSCEEVRREISNYLDDDMSPRMRRLLEVHLEQEGKSARHEFELPGGFSIRVRQMLAKEFEKAKS